jgi:hypothetical protein
MTDDPLRWEVWRQDDYGTVALVRRCLTADDAQALCAELTARGHKQLYWVIGRQEGGTA